MDVLTHVRKDVHQDARTHVRTDILIVLSFDKAASPARIVIGYRAIPINKPALSPETDVQRPPSPWKEPRAF